MTDQSDQLDDEIELIQLLQVIWKWKYVIIAGTVVCMLVVGFISRRSKQIYRIETLLQINTNLMIRENVDRLNKIKALIELGILNKDIKEYISTNNDITLIGLAGFSVKKLGDGSYLKISYNSPDKKTGVNVLNSIVPVLIKKYGDKIKLPLNQLILKEQNEISFMEEEIMILNININNTLKRIKNLELDIKFLGKNTELMIHQRDQILNEKRSNDFLSVLYFNNIIQKNYELKNTYNSELSSYFYFVEQSKIQIKRLELQIHDHQEKLKAAQNERNNYIQVIKPPENNITEIKSGTQKKIVLAGAAGLFMMLFLSFMLDYLFKSIKKRATFRRR